MSYLLICYISARMFRKIQSAATGDKQVAYYERSCMIADTSAFYKFVMSYGHTQHIYTGTNQRTQCAATDDTR